MKHHRDGTLLANFSINKLQIFKEIIETYSLRTGKDNLYIEKTAYTESNHIIHGYCSLYTTDIYFKVSILFEIIRQKKITENRINIIDNILK